MKLEVALAMSLREERWPTELMVARSLPSRLAAGTGPQLVAAK